MAPRRSGNGRHSEPGGYQHPGMAQGKGDHVSSNHLNSAMSYSNTVDTLSRDTTANMKLATMELAEKVMVIEERTIFLGDLVKMRRGTKEVENYVRKQENIRPEYKENKS